MGMLITSHDVGNMPKGKSGGFCYWKQQNEAFFHVNQPLLSQVFLVTSTVYLPQSKSMAFMDSSLEVFRYRLNLINSALMKMQMQIQVSTCTCICMCTSNSQMHADTNVVSIKCVRPLMKIIFF